MLIKEIVFGILGAAAAVANETLYRANVGNFLGILWAVIPIQAMLAWSIYMLLKNSGHIIGGVLVFSFFTWSLRLASARFVLGEPITKTKLLALSLLFCALIVDKLKLMG